MLGLGSFWPIGSSFVQTKGFFFEQISTNYRCASRICFIAISFQHPYVTSLCNFPDVTSYVYTNDIAFFESALDIHSLYERLQVYLSQLETWLDSVHLALNVSKRALLIFPIAGPVSTSLVYKNRHSAIGFIEVPWYRIHFSLLEYTY